MASLAISSSYFLKDRAISPLTGLFTYQPSTTAKKAPSGQPPTELQIILSGLALSSLSQDLPKDASIELKLDSQSFSLSRGSIRSGKPKNPDITISLPMRYISKEKDICEVISSANQNKDLSVTLHRSQTALLWKYRSMLKYRDCFGF
jgi:hypothetical protein